MLPAEDGGPLILYDAQDGHLSAQHGADGTSKVGSGDRPVLGVARLADPNDKYLVKWVRAPENPVKFDGAPGAFPGQVWKNDDHWNFIMQGKRYQSNDSKFMEWTTMDNMIGKGEHGGQWWSPVPNQVGGAAPPAGVPNYIVNVGGGDQYLFGQYSAGNETFAPWQLNGNEVEAHLEHGQAGWWGAQMANERMLMIGWATPDFHGDGGPGINFLTRLTLLREVNFDAKTMNLVSNPVPELVGLRSGSLASERAVAMSPDAKVIAGTGGGAAASADVNISFSGFKDGDSFGVCVLSSANGSTGIGISITVANKVASVKTGGCKEMMKASTRARTNANVSRYMPNTNFPKGDIRGLDHEFPTGTNWTACQGLCDKTAACEAWTFLARGGGMSCCIKGAVANDGCPAYARGMVSGTANSTSFLCISHAFLSSIPRAPCCVPLHTCRMLIGACNLLSMPNSRLQVQRPRARFLANHPGPGPNHPDRSRASRSSTRPRSSSASHRTAPSPTFSSRAGGGRGPSDGRAKSRAPRSTRTSQSGAAPQRSSPTSTSSAWAAAGSTRRTLRTRRSSYYEEIKMRHEEG